MMTENRSRTAQPLEDRVKQATQQQRIFDALLVGAQTNGELSCIALDYTRAIRGLRRKGIRIDSLRLGPGYWQYSLNDDEEPLSEVDVLVTLADGTQSIQSIEVRGETETVVKNRAQHLAAKVKILACRGHVNCGEEYDAT